MDGKADVSKQGVIDETYDTSFGVAPDPKTNDYEEPEDPDDLKQKPGNSAFGNPVYDANTNTVPPTHNYETMDDEERPVSTAGIDNLVYGSTVGSTVPPIGEYEVIDEEDLKMDGIHNATYDSTAGVSNTFPSPPAGLDNLMYDSRAGLSNGGVGSPLVNATYDSRAGVMPDRSSSVGGGGIINATYDSRPDAFTGSSVPPTNNYEDIDDDIPTDNYDVISDQDLSSGTAGNSVIPPTDNYEVISDNDVIPPSDNYEEIGDGDNETIGGLVNDTYDSTVGMMGMDGDRVASPYEVPVVHNDYELPHDGQPAGLVNVYDAPNS